MKIRTAIISSLAAVIAVTTAFGAREIVRRSIVFTPDDLALFNVVAVKDGKDDVFRLKDTTYAENNDPFLTDMALSFSRPSGDLTSDDTRRYSVRYASYQFDKTKESYGGSSGKFYRQEDRIEIAARENLWLSGHGDMGSFTIEMRLRPDNIREDAVLFSRVGYASGMKNGIEIRVRRGRVCAYLTGIFTASDGHRIDVSLTRGARMSIGRWQHYALSYDRITGKLAQFVDGREEEAKFVTDSGRASEGVLTPSFPAGDAPRSIIGKGFYGGIDEFRISYRNYEHLRSISDTAERRFRELSMSGRTPINKGGVITGGVQKFPYTGTMIRLFSWDDGRSNDDTGVWFEMRTSDTYFERDDSRLKWYRISNNQRNIYMQRTADGYLRGKYIQWRAHLIPSPEGDHTPEVRNIKMDYELDIAPEVPMFVKAVNGGDGKVILTWRKNVDFDLYGYRIYYGVRAGKIDGILLRIGGRPITNDICPGNTMKVTIDADLIEENRNIDSGMVLEYPIMKNNVLYYFAVSAYDSYKVDTPYNHESAQSDKTYARPMAGSEIGQ